MTFFSGSKGFHVGMPTGLWDPEPSPNDLHLTAEAIAAGRLLDMPVLDHLIVARDGYVSLRDRGITFERR